MGKLVNRLVVSDSLSLGALECWDSDEGDLSVHLLLRLFAFCALAALWVRLTIQDANVTNRERRTRMRYGTLRIPCFQTYLLTSGRTVTCSVFIMAWANFLISVKARGARFLKVTPWIRLWRLMVASRITSFCALLALSADFLPVCESRLDGDREGRRRMGRGTSKSRVPCARREAVTRGMEKRSDDGGLRTLCPCALRTRHVRTEGTNPL